MHRIIESIRTDLIRNADEKTKKSGERFFKEDVKLYGIKSALVSQIDKDHFKSLKDKNKTIVFPICEELWNSGIMEESFVACNWSFFVHKQYEPSDFLIFEKWVNHYVSNWASCDTLCNHAKNIPQVCNRKNASGIKSIGYGKINCSVSYLCTADNIQMMHL